MKVLAILSRVARFLLVYLLACPLFLLATSIEEGEESYEENIYQFSLGEAVSRALNANRQLFSAMDTVWRAEYARAVAESEFEIRVIPNGKTGYIGGGSDGTGLSVGMGMDLRKKFTQGATFVFTPSILKTPDHFYTDVRAIITQPLLRGFSKAYQLSGIFGAQFSVRSAYRNLYLAQQQLVFRTITALYEIAKTEKALELYQNSHLRIAHFYTSAKWKEKIGLADSLDVYRAQIELENAEDQLNNVQERFQTAMDNLKDILALPLDAKIQVNLPIIYTKNSLSLEEAVRISLENRVELQQAMDQKEETARLSVIAKENLFPELNVVMDYTNFGRNEVFTRTFWTRHRESKWGIGVTTSTDFNAINEKVCYKQSLMAIQSAERSIEMTVATLTLEVRKSLRNLERMHNRIEIQEKQIYTARSGLKLAELKFKRGLANNFDVIQAEKNLLSAEVTYWSALIDHIVGEYQFLAALGILCDKP
jgi:outer membrane protein TolC